jgi:hypothetical protein
LEFREILTKIALKLTEYLYRTWLSPSTLSTPCAPNSKHNNALHLPSASILPLRCRHGAGLRKQRGGRRRRKKKFLFSRLGAAYGVRALTVFGLTLALALALASFLVSWSPSGSQLTDVGSKILPTAPCSICMTRIKRHVHLVQWLYSK